LGVSEHELLRDTLLALGMVIADSICITGSLASSSSTERDRLLSLVVAEMECCGVVVLREINLLASPFAVSWWLYLIFSRDRLEYLTVAAEGRLFTVVLVGHEVLFVGASCDGIQSSLSSDKEYRFEPRRCCRIRWPLQLPPSLAATLGNSSAVQLLPLMLMLVVVDGMGTVLALVMPFGL